jgi:putative endonuclease
MDMNYTYIVKCSDGTLYTGWTNCLEKRLASHNSGKGAKYTRSRIPVHLMYYEEFPTKEEAMRREAAIKRLTRSQKEKLINSLKKGIDKTGMVEYNEKAL